MGNVIPGSYGPTAVRANPSPAAAAILQQKAAMRPVAPVAAVAAPRAALAPVSRGVIPPQQLSQLQQKVGVGLAPRRIT
jgi:hypothetical protein